MLLCDSLGFLSEICLLTAVRNKMNSKKSKFKSTFSRTPALRTKRLILRKMTPSDAADMYEYSCLPEVTRYLLWYPHEDIEQTQAYLKSLQRLYKAGSFYDWAIELDGKMIGTCGYTSFSEEHGRAEVGYVINPKYWGMGIATEAVLAAIEFAVYELGMNRIEGHFIEGNEASLAVMKKCGMSFEGYLKDYMYIKGSYKNIGICAITRKDLEKMTADR